MTRKKFWLGILVMVLVFGMPVIGCDNGSTGGSSSINSAAWAQLQGEWEKGEQSIGFSGNMRLPLIYIWTSSTTGVITNVLTVTANQVTFGNPQFGLPAESFNFSISGNELTVTNWSVAAQASAMNGIFTRSQQ
jgi:hypothetical protein